MSPALPKAGHAVARGLGITGHQHLDDENAWPWVDSVIIKILSDEVAPPVGISSLAVGADQRFARAVLAEGGVLVTVVPFDDYASRFSEGEDRDTYQSLLASSAQVEVLKRNGTDQEAYMAAGRRVVDLCELLIAVWDGEDARGLGGSADVVRYAEALRRPVVHINPVARECHQIG